MPVNKTASLTIFGSFYNLQDLTFLLSWSATLIGIQSRQFVAQNQ